MSTAFVKLFLTGKLFPATRFSSFPSTLQLDSPSKLIDKNPHWLAITPNSEAERLVTT